jgi:hypothetical protein
MTILKRKNENLIGGAPQSLVRRIREAGIGCQLFDGDQTPN